MAVIKSEFISFFYSVKNFFTGVYTGIRDFLLKYMDSTTLGILVIAFGAAALMLIFKRINHD